MTPGETIAAVLPFACLIAALFRARLVALALAPSCIGIIAGIGFGVDTSSASHPIRWIVPIVTLVLAGFAVVVEMIKPNWIFVAKWWLYLTWVGVRSPVVSVAHIPASWASIWRRRNACKELWLRYSPHERSPSKRATVASLLVLASTAPDLLALHPLFWAHTREWPLVPLQIALCGTILALLLAPERMVSKWLR